MAEEFILDWKVDQPYILADQPADVYTLLTIRPNPAQLGALMDTGSETALPAHLIAVVDVSDSMQQIIRADPNARVVGTGESEGQAVSYVETNVPSRRLVAQGVVRRLIDRLKPDDSLTLVAFDHRAYTLAAGVPRSEEQPLRRAQAELA